MNKLALLCAALGLLALGACRQSHLGADHGIAYRSALEGQRTSEATAVAPMDANDAHRVLDVHHGVKKTSRGGKKSSGSSSSSSSSSSSGDMWKGSDSPIKLEAK